MLDIEFKQLDIKKQIDSVLNYVEFVVFRQFDYLIDDFDTQYSADIVHKWFTDIIFFYNYYYDIVFKSVIDYLNHAGYDKNDTALFMNKVSPDIRELNNRPSNNDNAIVECFDRIFSLFETDIREYVRNVLKDDISDPQYSAITLTKRLADGMIIKYAVYGKEFSNIDSYLNYLGFPQNTYAAIKRWIDVENKTMHNKEQ